MPTTPSTNALIGPLPGQRLSADPARLALASYRFRYRHPVRWSDLQAGHISRIAQAQFSEDLRTVLMRDVLGPETFAIGHWKAVARAVTIEHLQRGDEASDVELAGSIEGMGRSSYSFALAVFQRGECLSLSRVVGVTVDDTKRPAPIPDEVRHHLARALWQGPVAAEGREGLAHGLLPEEYPFHHELPTRFSDTDAVGHINNVAVVRYHDNAWAAFQRACLGERVPTGVPGEWWLTRQEVSLQAETFYPQPVLLGVAVESIGDDHFTLIQALFQDGRCNGHQRCSVAVIDAQGRPAPIDADLRSKLARWLPARVR